jgi:hypothetical protein
MVQSRPVTSAFVNGSEPMHVYVSSDVNCVLFFTYMYSSSGAAMQLIIVPLEPRQYWRIRVLNPWTLPEMTNGWPLQLVAFPPIGGGGG